MRHEGLGELLHDRLQGRLVILLHMLAAIELTGSARQRLKLLSTGLPLRLLGKIPILYVSIE